MAKIWHPDKNPSKLKEAEEIFKKLTEAYEVLNTPSKREEYNRELGLESKSTSPESQPRQQTTRPSSLERDTVALFEGLVQKTKGNIKEIVTSCLHDLIYADAFINIIRSYLSRETLAAFNINTQYLIQDLRNRTTDVFKIALSHQSIKNKHISFIQRYIALEILNNQSIMDDTVSAKQIAIADFITREIKESKDSRIIHNLISDKELMKNLVKASHTNLFWQLLIKEPTIGVEIIKSIEIHRYNDDGQISFDNCYESLGQTRTKCPELFSYVLENMLKKFLERRPIEELANLFQLHPEKIASFFENTLPSHKDLSQEDLRVLSTSCEEMTLAILSSPIISNMDSFKSKMSLYHLAEQQERYAKRLFNNPVMGQDEKKATRVLKKWPKLYPDFLLKKKGFYEQALSSAFVTTYFEKLYATPPEKLSDETAIALLTRYHPALFSESIPVSCWYEAFNKQTESTQKAVLHNLFVNKEMLYHDQPKNFLEALYLYPRSGFGRTQPPALMQICRRYPEFTSPIIAILDSRRGETVSTVLSERYMKELLTLKEDHKSLPLGQNQITQKQIKTALGFAFGFKKGIDSSESDNKEKKAVQQWVGTNCNFTEAGALTSDSRNSFMAYVLGHEYRTGAILSFTKATSRFSLDRMLEGIKSAPELKSAFEETVQTLNNIKQDFKIFSKDLNLKEADIGKLILNSYYQSHPPTEPILQAEEKKSLK